IRRRRHELRIHPQSSRLTPIASPEPIQMPNPEERRQMKLTCSKCSGEGKLCSSRHGGNDPDVFPVGDCDACEGSGNMVCEVIGCHERAVGFDDDGGARCEDCLMDWTSNSF